MAVIVCPKCGKKISDKTVKCPHCGYAKPNETKVDNGFGFAFGTINYILLAVGIVLLGIGYILLAGGGSEDPNVFNEAMFDNRRLVLAPITIVLGIIVEICAIMIRNEKGNSKTEESLPEKQ